MGSGEGEGIEQYDLSKIKIVLTVEISSKKIAAT